ncbi:MAG: IS4 family transposase [Isosphaeraceae bacterium]
MAVPSPEYKTADLLDLFEQLLPQSEVEEFDIGHGRVFTTWMVIWLMVYQRSEQGATMAAAVAEMILGATSCRLPECKRSRDGDISANTGAYSQARSDLPVAAANHAIDVVARTMIEGEPPLWKGRRAFLIDGTSATTGHHPELARRFPPATNQHGSSHWPVVREVIAYELGSGLATRPYFGPMYGPDAVSETDLARPILGQLGGPSMIVYDRNFGIFSMTHAAVEAGHDVLVRMTDKRFGALVSQAVPVGAGEWTLEWRPSRWDRRNNPDLPADAVVRGRLIEVSVERAGKTIVLRLFTTDMESTPEELATLYGKRWLVEGDIKSVKQTLAMDCLSSRSVDMIEKEIPLGILAYNLVIQVRRLAARRAGIEPRELSFTRVMHLVQAFSSGLASAKTIEEIEARFEKLLRAAARCRLPRRTEFRSFPRQVIPRRRRFPERTRELVNINNK